MKKSENSLVNSDSVIASEDRQRGRVKKKKDGLKEDRNVERFN